MKYNVFSHLVGEGFQNVLKNKKSTGASIIIMCATMMIFGLFFTISQNLNFAVKGVEEQQGMRVFVNDMSEEKTKEFGEKIKQINGVGSITYISKEDALNDIKENFKENPLLIKSYDAKHNPFPASFVVTLTNLELSNQVQSEINKLGNIKEITVNDETIEKLMWGAKGIKYVSAIILCLLVLISVFIIANTIKLTVHARRKEISIMKYVGATNGFIRAPFIVEGIIIGVISAAISILILGVSYNFIGATIIEKLSVANLNINLLSFSSMFMLIVIVYLILGIGIGVIGSLISMKKYLKV